MEDGRITLKINAFEYVIDRLVDWFREVNPSRKNEVFSDFDKLKVFKLLFFVATAKASEETEGLLSVFDRFIAMPYGPVEVDVYNNIDKMKKYELEPKKIKRNNENAIELKEEIKGLINDSINLLKRINPELINYNGFKLVNISHKWYSWRYVFQHSVKNNVLIPKGLFFYDTKYYK